MQVKVEKQSRVEASLLIREEELIADFTINSIIRAMQSVIPVYVKDKKTNRILALLEISSDNLAKSLERAMVSQFWVKTQLVATRRGQ